MKNLDAFLLPSLTEGCSNAMLEAMYLKIPIIATSVGAASNILKDRGLLVEPRSPEEIYNALIELDDKSIVRNITQNSYNYLKKELYPENEVINFIRAYKTCQKS